MGICLIRPKDVPEDDINFMAEQYKANIMEDEKNCNFYRRSFAEVKQAILEIQELDRKIAERRAERKRLKKIKEQGVKDAERVFRLANEKADKIAAEKADLKRKAKKRRKEKERQGYLRRKRFSP